MIFFQKFSQQEIWKILLTLIFSKKFIDNNFQEILLKSIQKFLEKHEFLIVPSNISRNLSVINYEKSTIFKGWNLHTLILRKGSTKAKFQPKLLIVKIKKFPTILPPEPPAINRKFRVHDMNCFFKNFPATGGSAPRTPWFIALHLCIYGFFVCVCSRSKKCFLQVEKCAHFFIEFSKFFSRQ